MEKLWEAILSTSRVTEDPIKAWEEHNADLKARCDYLNSLGLQVVRFSNYDVDAHFDGVCETIDKIIRDGI